MLQEVEKRGRLSVEAEGRRTLDVRTKTLTGNFPSGGRRCLRWWRRPVRAQEFGGIQLDGRGVCREARRTQDELWPSAVAGRGDGVESSAAGRLPEEGESCRFKAISRFRFSHSCVSNKHFAVKSVFSQRDVNLLFDDGETEKMEEAMEAF